MEPQHGNAHKEEGTEASPVFFSITLPPKNFATSGHCILKTIMSSKSKGSEIEYISQKTCVPITEWKVVVPGVFSSTWMREARHDGKVVCQTCDSYGIPPTDPPGDDRFTMISACYRPTSATQEEQTQGSEKVDEKSTA